MGAGASAGMEASCIICATPLTGLLGGIGRAAGIKRSSQNPNLCNRCDVHVADGSIVEVAVFFADLTNFTPLTAELGPAGTHEVVDAFLRMAKEAVVKWDGFVVQFAGDEIMALFNVPLPRDDYGRRAVAAAGELQEGMRGLSERFGIPLQVTIGIACGHARVGRLGSDDAKDYTAVGDVVNRAARLTSHVEPGGILVDAGVYDGVRNEFPDARHERVPLKGFAEPVEVVGLGSGSVLEAPGPAEGAGRRPLRVVMLLAAVFGAPCAGFLVLNPLLVGAGLGAAGFGTAAAFLDQSLIRVPLITLATGAALANLFVVLSSRRGAPAAGSEAPFSAGPQWRRRLGSPALGIAISVVALSMVAFEFVAHAMMH